MTNHSDRQPIPLLTGTEDGSTATSAVCDLIAAFDAAAIVPCMLSLTSRSSPSAECALRLWASSRGLALDVSHHESHRAVDMTIPAFRVLRCKLGKSTYPVHEITVHLIGAV